MAVETRPRVLEVEQVGEVTIATILRRQVLEEQGAQEISRELLSLIRSQGCRKLLLNFGRVERLGTVLIGKVVAIHRAMKATEGRLALCQINPSVVEIFQILNLGRLLNLYQDEQQALESF